MALPVVVDASLLLSDTNHYNGPFVSAAGAVYVVGAISSSLSVHKADDPEVSWSQVGTQSLGGAPSSIWVVQNGDVLHCLTVRSGATVSYAAFNMATDTWSVTLETVDTLFTVAAYHGSLAVRSDGTVVAFYGSAQETVMGTNYQRVSYKIRSALGVWDVVATSVSGIGAQVNFYNAVCAKGDSDRVHFFYKDHTNNDGYNRSLSSLNIMDTAGAYDTTVRTVVEITGYGVYQASPTPRIVLAYIDSSQIGSLRFANSIANPPLAGQSGVTDFGIVTNLGVGPECLALLDGSHQYLVYISTPDSSIHAARNRGFGFDTQPDLPLTTDVASQRLSAAIFDRAGWTRLAWLYQSSGTVRYNEIVLSESDVTPLFPPLRRMRGLIGR